jgi:D-serine deaminase-like pyridoxal phosphate-dependent protein
VHPDGPEPITVSTLAEAEYFADGGYTDVIYAVGIAPGKLDRVVALHRRGVDLAVLLDSAAQAEAVAAASRRAGIRIPALIEIDCDGHRAGIRPDDPQVLAIGRILHDGGAEVRGVLDHAGESYFSTTADAQQQDAETERATVVQAARILRDAGIDCPVVSVGSTPTAHAVAVLDGVTEVRAGNFVFLDLVMAGIGMCGLDDLALSVVVTVIGHRPDQGWILTDGGWMAMSRDRGTATQAVDQGYGVVLDLTGRVLPDLIMTGASQEHGVLSMRPGSDAAPPDLPIGTRLRVLPNHACATAAQHQQYAVIAGSPGDGPAPVIGTTWPRINGW